MAYNFKEFDDRIQEIEEWLTRELSTVRTGRATPTLLDSIRVDSYGAKVPLNQVGTVGIEDPRTLRITAWDSDSVSAVERAIIDADLGVSVTRDDRGVRVSFPELTGERRTELIKLAKAKLEDARVSIRNARDDAMRDIEAGALGEDDTFRAKEDLQKRVEDANKTLQTHLDAKEKEITE